MHKEFAASRKMRLALHAQVMSELYQMHDDVDNIDERTKDIAKMTREILETLRENDDNRIISERQDRLDDAKETGIRVITAIWITVWRNGSWRAAVSPKNACIDSLTTNGIVKTVIKLLKAVSVTDSATLPRAM